MPKHQALVDSARTGGILRGRRRQPLIVDSAFEDPDCIDRLDELFSPLLLNG
jgi:hypothetical protein